ncbi:hypothetical protein SpCBS45565_g05876 [Spizellomyces sp. 'palustris']|nr:hypothetical protein SpCBS45565_g05876 [Spizellomyces sp. 'palustris']
MESKISSLPNELQYRILSFLSLSGQEQPKACPSVLPRSDSPKLPDLPVHANVQDALKSLAKHGFYLLDNVFDPTLAEDVLRSLAKLEAMGELRGAGMGTGITRHHDASNRGDRTRYFLNSELTGDADSSTVLPALQTLKTHLDSLTKHINSRLFPDTSDNHQLCPKGLQVAHYTSNGARYVKHRDASPLNPYRRLTILTYWNKDWSSEHGGCLRIYLSDGTTVDVEPRWNRMLIFRSELEHEVLPSFGDRFAITMWLYSEKDIAALLLKLFFNGSPQPLLPPDPTKDSTIFISIPSYRDPETHPTVTSLLQTAAYPHRLHITILYQDHPTQDKSLHPPLPSHPTITTLCIPSTQAKGPSYARALIAKTFENQDYILQIDSHMRFGEGWDTYLIQILECVRKGKGQHLITMYPPNYDPRTGTKDPEPFGPVIMYPTGFDQGGMLRISGRLEPHTNELVQQRLVASGFLFAPGSLYVSCPPDPNYPFLFFGEEIVLSARLWTRGWEFWTPGDGKRGVVWHAWKRGYRKTFWENGSGRGREGAQKRVRVLLGMEQADIGFDENMGLGRVRGLKEFEAFVGVCFKERTIEPSSFSNSLIAA